MRRLGIIAALAALVVTGTLSAADSPEVQALRQQVKALRTERDATVKAIHAQYDSVINQTKQSEAQAAAARHALAAQEKQIGALGNSTQNQSNQTTQQNQSQSNQAMQQNMENLRKAMSGEVKLDRAQIESLRVQRGNQVKLVRAAYDAKIQQLEAAIKAAKTTSKTTTNR